MFIARNIQADHKDLIHDVAYDFYGRRLATCSSDQNVKVNKPLVSLDSREIKIIESSNANIMFVTVIFQMNKLKLIIKIYLHIFL